MDLPDYIFNMLLGELVPEEIPHHQKIASLDLRFDFERDGTLRHRVWSLQGTERTLMLDVHHRKLEPKKD